MKKLFAAFALISALTLTSCIAGPRRLSRGWDDWTNQKYTEGSWIHGALLQNIIPVYPLIGGVMGFGDLFYNAYYFWGKDAWDNKGTGFNHENPTGTDKTEFAVWKD
jgi:hypothetical protein